MQQQPEHLIFHWMITVLIGVAVGSFFMLPAPGFTSQVAEKTKNNVKEAITTLQKSQETQDQWQQEKARLVATYEQLKQKQAGLTATRQALKKEQALQQKRLEDLVARRAAGLRIQKEMQPFLVKLCAALEKWIDTDLPFLQEARYLRLQTLTAIMADTNVSIAEKYRKVMDGLFVEAEYGNTIEVTQDQITLSGEAVLVDIFRLGRISLFALTLDQQSSAVFNVAEKKWVPLEDRHLQSIIAAVETGKKRRTVEIHSLPVGELAN